MPEAAFALRDYPIRPKRYSEVALASGFWKARVDTNATVTIPFEFGKREGLARSLSNNVLEAAILSLATHPNAALQAKVDARVRQLQQAQPGLVNAGFEVVATYYLTTGRRDLLDHAIVSAALLAADFARNDPPEARAGRSTDARASGNGSIMRLAPVDCFPALNVVATSPRVVNGMATPAP